ncbi:hypothetical protein POM88_048164 [Heracleum sosnowskyi]|uniref:NAC domain-containing protein n=1 Tax=Heracleum sosnowskyi TaxID=360622 RepID=A0AAD8GUT2_9APIA|nr:hypothetical protein POM88_048164 [Heracleum sosnowskyi]
MDPLRILSEVSCGKFEKNAYAFVNLTKKATNSNNKNKVGKEKYTKKAGCGTWDGQTKRPVRDYDGNLIGERRMLVFEINEVSDEEDLSRVRYWKMHEYNLCGINKDILNLSNTVLCKITLDHSKKAPIKLPDKTTHSIKATGEKNDTKKRNTVKMNVVTDSVQTCQETFNDDDYDFINSFFVEGEDGNLYVNMPDFEFGSNPELGVEQTLKDVTTNMGKRKLQAETSYVVSKRVCC